MFTSEIIFQVSDSERKPEKFKKQKNFSRTRELPEPILTTDLTTRFEEIATSPASQQDRDLHSLINQLPTANRSLLSWMVMHLDAVTQHEKTNKMNAQNLAMLLGPTLQMSHRLLMTLMCHCKTLFSDTVLHK